MRLNVGIVLLGVIFLGISGCSVMDNIGITGEEKAPEDTVYQVLPENKQVEYQYKYIQAIKLRLMGNTSDALEYLNQCIDIKPQAPDPYYQKSLIGSQLEEYQEAIRFGRKAVLYGPDNKWYRKNLGGLYLRNEVLDSARMQYEYLVEELKVNNLDMVFRLAQLYQETNKYQEALTYYNELEDRVGVNERISQRKKMIYAKIGEKEKAYREIRKLIEKHPDESKYYGMLAELYATFNEYEKAEKMYDRLFEMDSNNKLGQISLVRYYNNKGEVDKALETYKNQVVPNQSVDFRDKMLIFMNFLQETENLAQYADQLRHSLDSLGSYYSDKSEIDALYADLYLKTNEFQKASGHLETLATGPESKYIYWDQLLSIYSYLGKFENMFQYGQKALQEFDKQPRIYLLSGIGALQTNRPDSALSLLEKGIQYVEDDKAMRVQFYIQLGEAYHRTENYKQSDHYFKNVLELDPNNKIVLNNYSYYLSQREEKLKKALGYSHRVIKDEPNNPVYLDTYAWVLYKMGKLSEAKKYIEKAIKNGGNEDADILEHYGDILYKTGDEDKAIQMWKEAKDKGNQSEQLNYKLENKTLPDQSDEN